MPIVSQEFIVRSGNDPAENIIPAGERAMYLDMLLSEYYGKMVRQGSSFCINGVQASLRPFAESLGIDVGLSAEVGIDYVPVTQHSKAAWNNVFKGWSRQKKLQNAMGTQVRYDDLEFGWNATEGVDRGRTSTIYGQGLTDNQSEKLVLIGNSEASGTPPFSPLVGWYSLQDYYNSSYETPAASRNPFTNSDIKTAKWGATPFPQVQTIRTAATSSAGWFETNAGLQIHQSAITESAWQNLPTNQHSLCGVLYISAFIMPDDTVGQIEDDFILTVSISVKSWKSIINYPKRKYRASKAKPSNRRKGVRRSRYYGRRRKSRY